MTVDEVMCELMVLLDKRAAHGTVGHNVRGLREWFLHLIFTRRTGCARERELCRMVVEASLDQRYCGQRVEPGDQRTL